MFPRVSLLSFFLCFSLLGNAQLSFPGKWGHFVLNKQEKTQQPNNQHNYYLIKIKNFNSVKKKSVTKIQIQRILDNEYAIALLSEQEYKNFLNKHHPIWKANNLWKYSPNLFNKQANFSGMFVVKTNTTDHFKEFIQDKTYLKIINSTDGTYVIEGSFNEIKKHFPGNEHVHYIGLESLKPKLESKIAELDLSTNKINKIHHHYSLLDGTDQIISIKDNMIDVNDMDLAGKYIASSNAPTIIDPHATAMATIAVGAGNTSIKGKGVAYKSKVTSSGFESLFPDQFAQFSALNVSLQNHSYGTEIENFYGSLAEAYDQFCYNYPEFLHIFSSGNLGESTSQSGYYQGISAYANITGNFKMAKNILSIGSMDFDDKTAIFSSRGPAYDGRIKPDLVAYSITGTSNSTALTSGLSLLLQQQYIRNNGYSPKSSLIKACLINSATDIDNPGPDFKSGYGSIDGYAALKTLDDNHFFENEVTDSETKSFTLNIPANACKLKITLVWTDPPAQVNSNIALVNDLDLKLIAPDATEWLPWVLDASADSEKLNLQATRKTDRLNNVEQITLENLQEGNYTIEVNGFSISSSTQRFSLAYQWSTKDTFEWSYPTGSDAIALGDVPFVKLKWINSYASQNGELSVSYDMGLTWQNIGNQVNLNNESLIWNPEAGINSTAILKMNINDKEYLSDTFALSSETNAKVALDCEEIIELNWNKSSNALFYDIFNYQNEQLLKIATTPDTSFAFAKEDFASTYFAVEPVFANKLVGQRSETINYLNFSAECYFDSFYALSGNDKEEQSIEVFIELGSNYQIEKIELYKILTKNTELINEYHSPNELILNYIDKNPVQGLNQYQLKITLSNGIQYFSEIASTYFLSDKPFLLFPNPATKDGVNIFAENLGDEKFFFNLFNTNGQKVLQYQLQTDREFINFIGIKSGTYVYKINSESEIYESSTLIIQ